MAGDGEIETGRCRAKGGAGTYVRTRMSDPPNKCALHRIPKVSESGRLPRCSPPELSNSYRQLSTLYLAREAEDHRPLGTVWMLGAMVWMVGAMVWM
eukprot:98245-Pyramimonas_sp.AAC.1